MEVGVVQVVSSSKFSLKVSGGLLDNLVPGDVYHVVLQHVIFAIKGLRYFNCWKVGQTL